MSSPASSSSSRSPRRRPLRERSNSQQNTLASGIRLVPYSPPRPETTSSASETESSRQDEGDHDATHNSSPTARRKRSSEKEAYLATSPASALSSPSSSTSTLVRAKGRSVSGTKLGSGSTGAGPSTPPPALRRGSYGGNVSVVNAPSRHDRPLASPSRRSPRPRVDKIISVNSDKTFSIVLKPTRAPDGTAADQDRSSNTPSQSNYSTTSSHEGISFDAPQHDRDFEPSSPPTSVAERSVSPYSPASTPVPEEHNSSDSPWNYCMVGGLRKVPTVPAAHQTGKDKEVAPLSISLPPVAEDPSSQAQSSPLAAKPSFNSESSEQTNTTIEETTNYKVLGRSSPPCHSDSDSVEATPSSHSNYQLLGESSPVHPFVSSPLRELSNTDTPGSKNFIVHNYPSLSSFDTDSRSPRPKYSDDSLALPGEQDSLLQEQPSEESSGVRGKYSQESLVVPPLKPRKRSSSEKFGYYKQRSRESLRGRASSFSSISSIINQDVTSTYLASTPNLVRLGSTPSTTSLNQPSWARPSSAVPSRLRMEPEPHVWSSQLSTVMSEYEGSERDSRALSLTESHSLPSRQDSRSMSGLSMTGGRTSRHSRHILSISSSVAPAEEVSLPRSQPGSDSLDRPGPSFARSPRELPSPPIRMVRDVDEDGDGLADLHDIQELNHKSSRPRMSPRLASKSSDRSIRSSASSRIGSISISSLPAWARVYYGSGEKRLAVPSVMSYSDDSRPGSSWVGSASPSNENLPIFSPRRRPREMHPNGDRPDSMEITPVSMGNFRRGVRKMTSSIWSPHLDHDRRASRYSMWQPPSMTWSAEGGLGRRNIQVVLFALGFIFPFAWMIAAFLPLPPAPQFDMMERDHSTTMFGIPEEPEPFQRRVERGDDTRYQSALWWRRLNRFMSFVGLLIIGAIVALAVIGVRQKWMQTMRG
ncbi:uncharacterized protein BCR38DRAFT_480676 [Pseudomassariella vexata]|uniref:Serine-rich protein n=1 Tax=Pseudomassariella vexata TaxID=1141098 RepID=A0A1Y2ED33_9PEZI|nr:uncharacterized protein BCR38DRAFT_480676 [Pseudomassariella vexata]ORY69489.1 hypothetical protein BCR38DRAFT_480676 [Pseudomassariella vexata]